MEIDSQDRGVADTQLDDRDRTLRALEGHSQIPETPTQKESSHSTKEDLFLNLAIGDSARREAEDALPSERRKSRLRLASHRVSLPSSAYASSNPHRSSPALQGYDSPSTRSLHRHNRGNTYSFSSDINCESPLSAASSQSPAQSFTEGSRISRHGLSSRTSLNFSRTTPEAGPSPENSSYQRRKISLSESSQANVPPSKRYRHSTFSNGMPGYYTSSPLAQNSFDSELEGSATSEKDDDTESTVSTAAPSTVWDELDDLKSRIRKLELTGSLPSPSSTSAVDTAHGESPHTAAPFSSSTRRTRAGTVASAAPSSGDYSGSSAHPLLQAALKKSKTLISGEVYRALEAVASDALSLASMTGSTGMQGRPQSPISVVSSSAAGVERRLRRKAESLCRSLTELCITLSEGKAGTEPLDVPQASPSIHSESRGQSLASTSDFDVRSDVSVPMRHYQANQDLDGPSSMRSNLTTGLAPIDTRRQSTIAAEDAHFQESMRPSVTPTQASTPILSRPKRTTGSLLRRRRVDDDNGDNRAPSRAMTDLGQITNNHRENTPKDFSFRSSFPGQRSTMTTQGAPNTPLRSNYIHTSTPSIMSQLPTNSFLRTGSRRLVDRSAAASDTGSALRRPERREPHLVTSTPQFSPVGRLRAGSAGPFSAVFTNKVRSSPEDIPGDGIE
ncbi:hypothetical protein L228DRAFT_148616 [Xylona heveae TC161]|uniref:Uncharacterized protein n=1 Tax=Xylona heveae (strain CBS 132557 / TC161) TaxID=1328760 RepID=A0A165GI75_XYLHT|nr:hypothetical protein L228DRAFT_148616 [Xylona heveae TC161]KZF22214.1 hypothetical protein L228DRAFT_148616 [Xylona heveae TC161]